MSETRVLVTGGTGFLGRHIARLLAARKSTVVLAPGSSDFDLTRRDEVERCLDWARPDVVIHAAARVGGIGANSRWPGTFFRDNAFMGMNLIDACRARPLRKFVCLGTICSYPKHTPVPFHEEDLWNGYPEETNAPYGIAKKALLVMLHAYRQEFGFPGIFLLPVNLYGPGDSFDLESSHVIPAMMRKFVEAKERGDARVLLWGDGTPTREFLFVEDAAEGIVAAADRYDGPEPVNIGSGSEIPIRDLAATLRNLVGYEGSIEWDTSRPNGQPRRRLDTSRAEHAFGWRAKTPLSEGLAKTLDWYLSRK